MPRDLRALPKAHLHLHLEGAMRPATLEDLGAAHGIAVPDVGAARTFPEFIDIYMAACEVLRDRADFDRLFREIAEDAAAAGAVWVESHVDSGIYADRMDEDEVFVWFVAAAAAAEEATGVGFRLIVSVDRTRPVPDSLAQARRAIAHAGPVVALGLANDEDGHPPDHFAEAFALAREAGLLSVPHAGELAGPASVTGALDVLHPHRIGHGVRAIEDPAVVARLAAEGVCCDVCPTSNLALRLFPSMAEHPLRALLEAGVPVTLNADDPLMFGPGLLEQYELARAGAGLTDEQLAAIARTSIERSAMPPADRAPHLAAIAAWLAP